MVRCEDAGLSDRRCRKGEECDIIGDTRTLGPAPVAVWYHCMCALSVYLHCLGTLAIQLLLSLQLLLSKKFRNFAFQMFTSNL